MSKFFIDTEFIEGTQETMFGKTKPTIDLISIGIVAEDGREYSAVSKDFNLKEAWNRCQQRVGQGGRNDLEPKEYWIRENVLLPIVQEYCCGDDGFNYKTFKRIIKDFGKTNEQIAVEIKYFIANTSLTQDVSVVEALIKANKPEFYGYFADYDWVVFCWLYGKMIELPKGFPYYCRDLKQIMDDNGLTKKWAINSCPIEDEHNALCDARWNFGLFKAIQQTLSLRGILWK
jgi:hypothetical protein